MTTFGTCVNCGERVTATSEGMCPSCREPFKEDTAATPSVRAMPGILAALVAVIVGVLYACGGLFLLSSPFVLRTREVLASFGMKCEACGSYRVRVSGSEQRQRSCRDCEAWWDAA